MVVASVHCVRIGMSTLFDNGMCYIMSLSYVPLFLVAYWCPGNVQKARRRPILNIETCTMFLSAQDSIIFIELW